MIIEFYEKIGWKSITKQESPPRQKKSIYSIYSNVEKSY